MTKYAYIVLFLAVLGFLSYGLQYAQDRIDAAYEAGRRYERGQLDKAVIDTKTKESKAIAKADTQSAEVKIVYRDRVKYVEKVVGDFGKCVMSDELYAHLDSIRTGGRGPTADPPD